MQRDSRPGTPKANSAKKNRQPSTPESRGRTVVGDMTLPNMNRTTNLRHRAMMGHNETILSNGLVTKRRIGNPFRANLLSQNSGPIPVRAEPEAFGDDLDLLHDRYLQSSAIEELLKRKVTEKEKSTNAQLSALVEERTAASRKLEKETVRGNDVQNLTVLQNDVDSQLIDVAAFHGLLKENQTKAKLLRLKNLLEPLDQLRCNGIIIPQSPEELEDFQTTLRDIDRVLINLQESIGEKGTVYQDIKIALQSYISNFEEIKCRKNKFNEVLCGLQALALKAASHCLSQTEAGDVDGREVTRMFN